MRLEIKILLLTREQFSSALLPHEQQSLRFSTRQAKFLSVFFRSIFLTEPLHALGSCHLYHPCRSANMNLLWGFPNQRPDCFMFAGYMSLVQLILVDLSYSVLSCKNAAVSVSDRLNSRHLEIWTESSQNTSHKPDQSICCLFRNATRFQKLKRF